MYTMLSHGQKDFSATFMGLRQLKDSLEQDGQNAGKETVTLLKNILTSREHSQQSQAYFLYREAASSLVYLLGMRSSPTVADHAYHVLKDISVKGMGTTCMAASEALGSLPLDISGPVLQETSGASLPVLSWNSLVERFPELKADPLKRGRSYIFSVPSDQHVFVLKTGETQTQAVLLCREAEWMRYLLDTFQGEPVRFEIPQPVLEEGEGVIALQDVPFTPPGRTPYCGLLFRVHREYFSYPNDTRHKRRLSAGDTCEVLGRNSRLLGRMAGKGIFHQAPIPLFHNRVQQNRRDDGGLYLWQRMGRLDRWLHSCWYPNVGVSGVRDFEHLISHQGGGRQLYFQTGVHLLGLFLIAASWFRAKEPERMGWNANKTPVDMRHLFDPDLLKTFMWTIFTEYFQGFTGGVFKDAPPDNLDSIVARMVEETGMDRHMTETVRIADQQAMTDDQFAAFLMERGMDPVKARTITRGEREMELVTGPHLGAFNSPISLPELIEFVAGSSACCIAAKYLHLQYGRGVTA